MRQVIYSFQISLCHSRNVVQSEGVPKLDRMLKDQIWKTGTTGALESEATETDSHDAGPR